MDDSHLKIYINFVKTAVHSEETKSQTWTSTNNFLLWAFKKDCSALNYTECPTRYRTPHFFNNITTNEDIATKFEADLPRCARNVTSYHLLFKFRCSIFIGLRIIK